MEGEQSPFKGMMNETIIKQRLRNSSVINKGVSLKRCLNVLKFTWCVGSYCDLKTGATYERVVEKAFYSCTFRLERQKRALILRASTNGKLLENGSLLVYMNISEKEPSDSENFPTGILCNSGMRRAFKETKGNFILTFPSQTLAARQKVPLYVLYLCISRSEENRLMFCTANVDKESASEISDDISFEKHSPIFCDFSFIVGKRVFPAHKCILATRSRYFSEYFRSRVEVRQMEVEALPGIVWYVLCYVYAGQIDVLDMNAMIQILKLAKEWEIFSLVEICSDYLRANMDLNSMKKVVEEGLEVLGHEMLEITKRLEKLQLEEEKEN